MSGLQPLTPNMNRLVVSGMEFTNFYTTPMCSTSRAELLTGRHYPRTGSFYINSEHHHGSASCSSCAHVAVRVSAPHVLASEQLHHHWHLHKSDSV